MLLRKPVINSFISARNLSSDDDQNSFELNGTSGADQIVNVFDGDALLGSVQSNAEGDWNFATDILGPGAHSFTAAVTGTLTTTTSAVLNIAISPVTSAITIADGGSAEIDGPSTQSVTFSGTTGTLKVDQALTFFGQISDLAGSDALDLGDVSFGINTEVTYLGNITGGTLTITDGADTANITLQGNYLSSQWTLSSDGNGGTVVVDPVPVNAWQELKIGAGGYLTGIDIAPDGTMVVRTDTYGAYIWNGTQWQQLVTSTSMPAAFLTPNNSAGVYEIQIAPSNSNILYMMYEGDVLKSTDKGTTWTLTSFSQVTDGSNDPYRMNGQKMAIDPNNPNVVYVGTPQNGLFVTTDGGVTWQNVTAVPVSQSDTNGVYPGITGIQFDPAVGGVTGGKTNTIFASSYGNGVFESTNGGSSWTALSGGPTDVEYSAVSSTGIYYAVGDKNTSLWSYANGTWNELLTPAVVGGNGIQAVAINPNNPLEIVVQTAGGSLNVSYDGGTTWSGDNWGGQLNATDIPWLSDSGFMSVGGIAFSPSVPNELITSDGVGVWNTTVPLNLQWNTPVVFNSQSEGIEQLVANEIIVPPGGKPVLASWDRAFFYVANPNTFPSTYGPVDGAFAAGWSLDYASSTPSFVVGIADWWGIEESGYSTDGGQTWTPFASEAPTANGAIGGSIAASSPTDILWAPADGNDPYYTLDGGITWNPVVLPGVTNWSNFDWAYYLNARTVAADRVLPDTFYLYYPGNGTTGNGYGSGLYKSTDGGSTWTQVYGVISPGSGASYELQTVTGEAGNLFFTQGIEYGTQPSTVGFYQSTNGGTSWTAVANVSEVVCFGFGAAAPGQSYPSIYIVGWVNSVYGIWQSNDDAKSWTMIGNYPAGSLDTIRTISGDPNIYGQVYVGFGGSGYAYLPAASAGPNVTGVATSPSTSDLNAGNTVTLTLNLSSAATVAGGVPTLTLNDGGTATYTGGSGTNALTFSYTVGVGQNTPSLAATAVNLNGATVQDGSGNAASLSLSGLTQTGPQIDTATPSVSSVATSGTGITAGAGDLNAGHVVTLTVNLSEAVTVAGGSPTLTLNDGGIASYTGGSGTNALTFSYTVGAGQNTADLSVTAFNPGTATITNGAGTAATLTGAVTNPTGTLQIDTTTPSVSSVTTSGTDITAGAGDLNAGHVVTLTVNLSEAVTVAGGVTLTLNDGGTATYTGGSGTTALTFSYTVGAGQNTADLSVTAFNQGTATITNGAGTAATLTGAVTNPSGILQIDTTNPTVTQVVALPVSGTENPGSVITLTLDMSSAVTVTGTPTLTLNDGGTATYTSGSGSNALTFSYTVRNTDTSVPTLAITQINLPTGATVLDTAGNTANLSGAVTSFPGLSIDPPPVLLSISESPSTGDLKAGRRVTLMLALNDAVTVAGGVPTLTLNDGGIATYASGSGTNTLTFSYTVGAGDNTASLAATAVNLNGSTVQDGSGNAATLSLNGLTQTGPQIDTNTPSVSSVGTSGTGVTAGTGDLAAGSVVTLTVNLSEAVTVAGGTPTLTLNNGGTATYTGGSGSTALTFRYAVANGQNTTDLAVTAVNLSTATVTDGAGNAANLSGAVTNPTGTLQIDTSTTHVTRVGNNFFLYNVDGSGPSFKFGGTPFVAGEFGAWTLIGAGQTSGGGYDVALKVAGADQYTVWSTDSNGNFVSALTGTVSGNSTALESFEPVFHQDLNGDGTIGLVTTVIQTDGSTSLTEVGNNFYFYNGSGSGPSFKFGGTPFTAGEFGAWTLIGAVQVAGGGYDVALKVAGADQYAVWSTDSNGNFVAPFFGTVSGSSTSLESFEPVFHQDLNGDGMIGLPTTVVRTDGSTSLTEVGNNFYFYNTSGSGPSFKFGGTPFTAGEFGAWTLIGAEQVAGGYDVALKVADTDQYTVWNTDSNGNFVAPFFGTVSGSSTSLESFESVFQQDLNGDGTIGLVTTVIESAGSTSLTEVGNNFYFYNNGGSGPSFKFGGTPFTAGEFGAWTLIGAEQTSGGGYDVALKVAGADQYAVWRTDSNGNFVSALTGTVSGNSAALESFEPVFHQDLNGDGTIGLVTTVIEASGSTSLTEVGNNFYFYNSSGSDPSFKFGGTPFTAGEFGAWTLIGAEQTSGGGYDVALKVAGADQYTVWSTDSNGNFVSALTGTVSGNSAALESFEPVFHQDLNGDGVIGPTSTGIPATSVTQSAPIVVGAGETVEVPMPYAGAVMFNGSTGTLKLDNSSNFSGTVAGMNSQDTLDLSDINFAALQQPTFSGTTSGGTLSITDGTHSASIALLGNYMASTFATSSDGHGGTYVVDPSIVSTNNLLAQPQHA